MVLKSYAILDELRAILNNSEYQDVPWPEILREMGLRVTRSTPERTVHNCLDIRIHHYVSQRGLLLIGDLEEIRYQFVATFIHDYHLIIDRQQPSKL